MEGWAEIMYMCMDAYNPIGAGLIFVALILLGSFVMLNLVLAVITDSISDGDCEAAREAEIEREDEEAFDEDFETQDIPWIDSKPDHKANWRHKLCCIINNSVWNKLLMGIILANVIVLAMDHNDISDEELMALERANLVFTFVFGLEMVIMIMALGICEYVHDAYNIFDAIIVVASFIEIGLEYSSISHSGGQQGGGMSALRTARLFRVFKLAKGWENIHYLLVAMQRTTMQVSNFAILLSLFVFVYSLVGLEFFSNRLHFDPGTGVPLGINDTGYTEAFVPRMNFDTFLWSLVAVFSVLTGENWNVLMYDCWRATSWLAPIYFLSLVILGGFVIMNVFLAILLSNFDSDISAKPPRMNYSNGFGSFQNVPEPQELENPIPKRIQARKKNITVCVHPEQSPPKRIFFSSINGRSMYKDVDTPGTARMESDDWETGWPTTTKSPSSVQGSPCSPHPLLSAEGSESPPPSPYSFHKSKDKEWKYKSSFMGRMASVVMGLIRCESFRMRSVKQRLYSINDKAWKALKIEMSAQQYETTSLWMFHFNNVIRQAAIRLSSNHYFQIIVLCIIILSSITLALDNPLLHPASKLATWLNVLNTIFTIVFILESALKVLAMGFCMSKGSYLRNRWNQLDFFIVMVTTLGLVGIGGSTGALKKMRILRVILPLRMISRNPELKAVVDTIALSIPPLLNVSVIVMLFYLIWAVFLVTFLKGSLNACLDVDQYLSVEQIKLLTYPVAWSLMPSAYPDSPTWLAGTDCEGLLTSNSNVTPTSRDLCSCMSPLGDAGWGTVVPQRFDNIFTAMGALYEISTTEGWVDVMIAAVDQRGADKQPVKNNQPAWVLFFIVFMLLGAIFMMNLFVGVMIDNFKRVKNHKGAVFVTKEQEEWQKMQKLVNKVKPKKKFQRPNGWFRNLCFDIMMRPNFDFFITICIIVNSVVMGMRHFGETYVFNVATELINYGFTLIFTLEAILKINGIGRYYFSEQWNRFDFAIVIGTSVGILLNFTTDKDVGTVASVIRIFRLARILRLIKSAKNLRKLFNTLVNSLPSFINIGGLLLLLFFIYAVLGVQLFAKIAGNEEYNDHANFRKFWIALLTLFRFSTGENWNGFMYSLNFKNSAPDCDPNPESHPENFNWCEVEPEDPNCRPINGCGTWIVFPYFYSFTLIVTFVMLNLFIGVILDSFANCDEEGEVLTPQDFEIFSDDWAKFDPDAACYMNVEDLPAFFQILDEPLGLGEDYEASQEEVREMIVDMDIPLAKTGDNRVHILDVAKALTKRVAESRFQSIGFLGNEAVMHRHGRIQLCRKNNAISEHLFNSFLGFQEPDDVAAAALHSKPRAKRDKCNIQEHVEEHRSEHY
eukprot:163604_1